MTVTVTNSNPIGSGLCSYTISISRMGDLTGTTRVIFAPNTVNTQSFTVNQSASGSTTTTINGPCSGIAGTITFTRTNSLEGTATGPPCESIGTLPVELVAFSGSQSKENEITLKWTTSSEINNRGFEIQRSHDALDWALVAFVKGNGNSTQRADYEYQDNEAITDNTEVIYYRLKQMDYDGALEYSPVISVDVSGNTKNGLRAFPNPAIDYIQITSTAGHIKIYNSMGQMMKTYQVETGANSLNISSLPSGTYFMRLDQPNGKSASQRFVIRR